MGYTLIIDGLTGLRMREEARVERWNDDGMDRGDVYLARVAGGQAPPDGLETGDGIRAFSSSLVVEGVWLMADG